MKYRWTSALLLSAGCTLNAPGLAGKCHEPAMPATERRAPLPIPQLDHHQHLLSEGGRRVTVEWLKTIDTAYARQSESEPLVDGDQLVRMLDDAGIPKSLVFSSAYYFSRSDAEQPGEYDRVRAENDWTLAQVRRHPTRLYAACSVNPRRGHATAEIERCAASGAFKALKVHFDASGIDVLDPAHVAAVRQAFATANRLRLPIVAHLQSEAGTYGEEAARIFLTQIAPAAPDVPITVNHLWGGGLYNEASTRALTVFAEAFQRRDPMTANLWFDLAQASMMVSRHRHRAELVERMRQIGFARLLYGSDGPQWNGMPPKQHWEEFSACMPLTRAELDSVASNVAPYLR
jgi:predicted TIM-barrel fold metal-dependent hydrolase